jgi:hypothetical protein
MTPQHDEIVKQLEGGFSIAWDTTRVDKAKLEEVRGVAREQAAQLGEIIKGTANASKQAENPTAGRSRAARRRRTARAAA